MENSAATLFVQYSERNDETRQCGCHELAITGLGTDLQRQVLARSLLAYRYPRPVDWQRRTPGMDLPFDIRLYRLHVRQETTRQSAVSSRLPELDRFCSHFRTCDF